MRIKIYLISYLFFSLILLNQRYLLKLSFVEFLCHKVNFQLPFALAFSYVSFCQMCIQSIKIRVVTSYFVTSAPFCFYQLAAEVLDTETRPFSLISLLDDNHHFGRILRACLTLQGVSRNKLH